MTFRRSVAAAVGLGTIVAALTLTATGSAVAQGVLKPVQAFIVNSSDNPVPVSLISSTPVPVAVNGPLQVVPPLWQGTPFVESKLVFNELNGIEDCDEAFVAKAGTAVLLSTVTGSFNVKPGSYGAAHVRLTMLDGTLQSLNVPAHRTAGTLQIGGIADGFSGSLYLPGLPVIKASACVIGVDGVLTMDFLGYTVPLPVIQ